MFSHLVAERVELSEIIWIAKFSGTSCGGYQTVGNLSAEVLSSGVDLDDLVYGVFTNLAVYAGSLSMRLVLPCGDIVEVSSETSSEFGPEVLSVTFMGDVPDWLVGRWVP